MFSIFRKEEPPLLTMKVNGKKLCVVTRVDVPCEKTPSIQLSANSVIELTDHQGVSHRHELGKSAGWYHFSVRVHSGLACQVDCVISEKNKYEQDAFAKGEINGIRFQPFFISGANVKNEDLHGKGLFARGLHFSGTVTPGNVVHSCECDQCRKSFQIRSYHAGFSNSGYFYSASGKYTITVSNEIPGCPVALSTPDPEQLAALEENLPLAPDGTSFKYLNPFRCPHCLSPYIDFEKNPEDRPGEYYGNYFVESNLLNYTPPRG